MGGFSGALAGVRPDDLAAHAIRALVERTGLPQDRVDDVVWGAANQAGEDNRNVARMALLLAGLPVEIPGVTVNRLCGSGLEAVNGGYREIRSEEAEIVIAGGSESMTRAPFVMSKAERAYDRNVEIHDTAIGWRFVNPRMKEMYGSDAMGATAEINRRDYGISREEQDAFALQSHQRAVAARDAGTFDAEVTPIEVPGKKRGETILLERDEPPRPETTLEKLATLKAAFEEGGTVTAGNSSSLNDGAAAILLASEAAVREHSWTPKARVVTSAVVGVEPRRMGIGPAVATRKALKRSGLTIDDIDLIELNEAFAAQSLACIKELDLDQAKVNVNGGAIALGHPLGCSGARILTTLVHEMDRRDVRYGLATMCIGVGQGIATIVERA